MHKTNFQIKHSKINKYSYPSAKRHYSTYKNLEREFNITLEADSYYIVRFDGKGMTKDYKQNNHAMDVNFYKTMKETFKTFCSEHENVLFGYSYSDEISILIKGNSNPKSIHSRLEKILSLYSSELSILFYKTATKNKLYLKSSIFDARIIKIQKVNIVKYFCLRQEYAICDFLQQLRDKNNIDKNVILSTDIIYELKNKNVDYYNHPAEYRFGIVYSSQRKIPSFEFANNIKFLENIIQNAIHLEKVENH